MKKTVFMLTAAAFAAFGALAAPALAQGASIAQAKSQCVVGEKNDGYLGVIDNGAASAELRREVQSINQQRKSAYARLAERNGVTVEVTAKLTAEKLINQAPSGHCVQDASGRWLRK